MKSLWIVLVLSVMTYAPVASHPLLDTATLVDSTQIYYAAQDVSALQRLLAHTNDRALALLCRYRLYPLTQDPSYLKDPEKADDSRWLHRPRMDWSKVARRHDRHSVEGRLFGGLLELIEARKATPALHNFALFQPMWTNNVHVFAFARQRHDGKVLVLANFDEHPQSVQDDLPYHAGIVGDVRNVLAGRKPLDLINGRIQLEPYEALWLTGED